MLLALVVSMPHSASLPLTPHKQVFILLSNKGQPQTSEFVTASVESKKPFFEHNSQRNVCLTFHRSGAQVRVSLFVL